MKRKLVSTFLSVAMAASLLVGCGGGSAPASSDTQTSTETTTETATETEASTEETTEAEPEATTGQLNALDKAMDYLSFTAFSKKGLRDQLEYDGYNDDEIEYAVDNCGADWNEQAKEKAAEYLKLMSFSKSGLIIKPSSDSSLS